MEEDELEDGELDDDDGECDDVTPDLKTLKNEPTESITDKIRSLSENSAHVSVVDRLENSIEYGEDVDKPDDVKRKQFTGRKHRPNHNHRRKLDSHYPKDEQVTKKTLKTYEDLDGTADDVYNDVDRRTPLKWSQNNVWSRSPRGPYDSPNSSTDDDGDLDDRRLRATHLPSGQLENDRFEQISPLDRNRSRRRQRRHHVSSARAMNNDARGLEERLIETRGLGGDARGLNNDARNGDARGIGNDPEFDVTPMSRNYPKETLPCQIPKLTAPSRKRKLVDTPMDERPVCKFFMDGKCVKGDECPFNHDFQLSTKKPELCRYYMSSGGCSKGAMCAFYHSDWPCKNFHRRGVCSYGESCKFSHEELTAETRKLLDMPFGVSDENSPQQQQSTHQQQQQNVTPSTEKKKIPSLLDIPIYLPGSAPKSSPPGTISHTEISAFRYFEDDSDTESNNALGFYGNGSLRRPTRPPLGRLRSSFVDEDDERGDEEPDDKKEFDKHRKQYSEQEDYLEGFGNEEYNEEHNGNQRFGRGLLSNKQLHEELGVKRGFGGGQQSNKQFNEEQDVDRHFGRGQQGNKQCNEEQDVDRHFGRGLQSYKQLNEEHDVDRRFGRGQLVNKQFDEEQDVDRHFGRGKQGNKQFDEELDVDRHFGRGQQGNKRFDEEHDVDEHFGRRQQGNKQFDEEQDVDRHFGRGRQSNKQLDEEQDVGRHFGSREQQSKKQFNEEQDIDKPHNIEPNIAGNKLFNPVRSSNVQFNAIRKNLQNAVESHDERSLYAQNSNTRFKPEHNIHKISIAEQRNTNKWHDTQHTNSKFNVRQSSSKPCISEPNSNGQYDDSECITIPYDEDEEEEFMKQEEYTNVHTKCKTYVELKDKVEDDKFAGGSQQIEVERTQSSQSKKQNELSDDVDGENQHQSYEEIYHVDDADLMRLPAAQRQLFLRIKKNQRQNDDAEGKADGPNISETNNDDKWYSSDEDEQDNTQLDETSAAGSDTSFSQQPPTSHQSTSVQPPPLLFNVPPPPLLRPMIPPPHQPGLPQYGMPIPNVPPPLLAQQQGLPPPTLGMPMHPMNPHRLPPSPSMMGPSMRPDLTPGLLGPGPRQALPPGIRPASGLHPPSLLGPSPGHNMMNQGPQPLLGQGRLLGQGPPQPLMRPGGMIGQGPQPLLGPGPGGNLLGQNMNLPQFDIGQILSAIRSNMTTETPPNSSSTDPSTGSSARDPRAGTVITAAAASDPRLRCTSGKPQDGPESKGPSLLSAMQTPESPTSPASPPAADYEVNVAGQRVAYFLRKLTINELPPSIPSHVSIDELKQRSDPRLARYRQRGHNVTGAHRLSSVASPDSDQTLRRRSPSLYTLPDIILPPLPVPVNSEDSASGTGASRTVQSMSLDTIVPKLPEALQEKNSTLHKEGLILQRQLSTASSDSETSSAKKVIDYRNDPRFKKKKTVSKDDIANTSAEQTDEPLRQIFRSGFYGTCSEDEDMKVDSTVHETYKNSDEAAKRDVRCNWNSDDRMISPPPTSSSQPSSFLSLTVANASLVADDDDDDDDNDDGKQVSLKDMFKTIDPTTSPFC